MGNRVERDTLGEVEVADEVLWGAQTQRALGNGIGVGQLPEGLWLALVRVKRAAAQVNGELGLIPPEASKAIREAAASIIDGNYSAHFPLSPFMTGSGTSANMNVNEVLSNMACEALGSPRGAKDPVHPNDHVNRCQSSNDVFPTALHLAAVKALSRELLPSLEELEKAVEAKATQFRGIVKLGRTHLMDALPVRLGSEFSAYGKQLRAVTGGVRSCVKALLELPLGGTAVGTGVNSDPKFAPGVIELLAAESGFMLKPADNSFAALGSRSACVAASAAVRGVAVELMKIANDLRWMASGPRGGLGELTLPAVQPGSSIMPGKVNPVVPEAVLQASVQTLALDSAVAMAGGSGVLELNLMMPLIAYNLLTSIELMAKAATLLGEKCVQGLTANPERCREHLETSLALVTPLAQVVGYEKAAEVAHKAHEEGITLREAALALGVGTAQELDELLDPLKMV